MCQLWGHHVVNYYEWIDEVAGRRPRWWNLLSVFTHQSIVKSLLLTYQLNPNNENMLAWSLTPYGKYMIKLACKTLSEFIHPT